MQSISFRTLTMQDQESVADIIRKVWQYDRFVAPATAKKLGEVYLKACLTNQTWTQVAVMNGQVCGVIFGKHIKKHRCSCKQQLAFWRAAGRLLCSKEAREVTKVFSKVSQIDNMLLQAVQDTFQAELALFAVSPEAQGYGIGKGLYQKFCGYLQQENIQSFYLFTDTSCNYGFYEHQGLQRKGEIAHTFEIAGQEQKMQFFLYGTSEN